MLEVTARSVANILEVSDYHLSLETDEIFEGTIELDGSYLSAHRKGKESEGLRSYKYTYRSYDALDLKK